MSGKAAVFGSVVKRGFKAVFLDPWPMWLGGVLVGILSIITFAWDRPWGVVGGLRNWADWMFYGLGLYSQQPFPSLYSTNAVLTFGLIAGALVASLMSRQFALRKPPPLELAKGVVGGCLLGIGAAFAGGCNVGGFYTAMSALSLSSVAMMFGLMAGAWVGLKYLYWEMEHLPSGGGQIKQKSKGADLTKVQPWLGALLLIGLFVASEVYSYDGYIILGGLLLCGAGFGFVLYRSRLCFARCFREPFMTGESDVPKAVILSLLISILGFATLKWVGLRAEGVYVTSNFGLGGLLGGFIFGFGMLLAGGCGSGTAWRAAEGQIKLIVALFCFAAANSLTRAWTDGSETMQAFLGTSVFLPDYLGYQGTLIALTAFLMLWYAVVVWNEETDAFVVEP